jgi:hypothetical protein
VLVIYLDELESSDNLSLPWNFVTFSSDADDDES